MLRMPKYTQDGTSKNLLEPYGPNEGEIKGGDITVLSLRMWVPVKLFAFILRVPRKGFQSAVCVQRDR